MTTDQKTRPPVWIRKFKAWANTQPLNEDDFVELGRSLPVAGTPWAGELPNCEIVEIRNLHYYPARELVFITLIGRNRDDHTILTLPGGDFPVDSWPGYVDATYNLDDMPSGGKRFLLDLIGAKR